VTDIRALVAATQCVGFDLDLTLADTREATATAVRSVNRVLGVNIDVQGFVARIGGPLRQEFASAVPEPQLDEAIAQFRSAFLSEGLGELRPLPGARELLAVVASEGWRSGVITSRLPHIAQAILSSCELKPDFVVGGLTGREKAAAIIEHGVGCYVGDHVLDMAGALEADVFAVGVLTGTHGEDELRQAGAALVVDGLGSLAALLGHEDTT
jgi:phosphoglycolate phosphatase